MEKKIIFSDSLVPNDEQWQHRIRSCEILTHVFITNKLLDMPAEYYSPVYAYLKYTSIRAYYQCILLYVTVKIHQYMPTEHILCICCLPKICFLCTLRKEMRKYVHREMQFIVTFTALGRNKDVLWFRVRIPVATVSKIGHFRSLHWRPSWLSCINEYLAIYSGGHASDLVFARNCSITRMLPAEAELVSEWTGLPGEAKRVKWFERSNGPHITLYKNYLYLFLPFSVTDGWDTRHWCEWLEEPHQVPG